ncbi:hypothetical protein PC117_g21037 [Phytophthora cactorum]|uniref:Uncharacterized protein n=1 Tax=Phytophthora cactorum TaxID=29920 RepID=A0A8T1BJ91_9STRA|nr:hypothetical protein PC117_g21037 [Phytophthora cactorum]
MSLPPTTNSPIFNSSFYLGSNDYLTIAVGDKRYQKLGGIGVFSSLAVAGSLACGSLTIAGSVVDLSSLSGVTAGTIVASKLVMVDANKDVSSFRNLTATNFYGTIQTSDQPNITSVGTLSSLTVSGSITGTLSTTDQPYITSLETLSPLNVSGSISGTLSTAAQPNITSLGTLPSLTVSGSITGTLSTAAQPNITSLGTLSTLTVSGSIAGGNVASFTNSAAVSTFTIGIASSGGACDLRTTTANDLYFGANNTRRLAINQVAMSASITSPSYQLDVSGSFSSTSFYMNGTLVTTTASDLNGISGYGTYLSGIMPGTVSASKAMVTNSNSVIQFRSGSATTNQMTFFANTSLRDSIRVYRVDDSGPLTIGTQIDGSASTNRTYPILNLVSSIDPTAQVGGVSATSADLFNINWNDKPSVGFTSQTHRFCFNVGNSQPYKTGYPHTFALATSADAICLNPTGSTATPSSGGCLYLVNDTTPKLLFNTNTPYSSSLGTAPITLQQGNMYIRCTNAFNDGSTAFDTAALFESSNVGAPIAFAFQLSNGSSGTSTNSAYMGTVSNNDFVIMTNNSRKVTLTAAGRLDIGLSAPSAQLDVSGSVSSIYC